MRREFSNYEDPVLTGQSEEMPSWFMYSEFCIILAVPTFIVASIVFDEPLISIGALVSYASIIVAAYVAGSRGWT